MRLRIVAYNIMSGGEGRADPLAEVLLAQCADIILIEQATNPDVLQRLASRLDMNCQLIDLIQPECAFLSRISIDEILDFSAQIEPKLLVGKWTINAIPVKVAVGQIAPPADVVAWIGGESKPDGWIEPKLIIHRRVDDSPSHVQPDRSVTKIFVPDNVNVIDAWMECDRLAVYASDHLPVGVEIEL